MEEQTKTKDVHALIQFCDILGNAYYEEYLFAEDETKHIQPVLNAISGKTPFDALPEDADKIASELFRIASRTIANVCINDFSIIFSKADIKKIYANGDKAYSLFRKYYSKERSS